jgi:hypothetical protein
LGVAQPHRRQIRTGIAGAGHGIKRHYAVFAAITLRSFYAQLVKAFEIVLVNGWYGSTFLCRFDEGSKGCRSVKLLILHLGHQL